MMYIYIMYSRELLKGILKPIILKLLAEHDRMYGYEMAKTIKQLSKDKILVKEGSLYPTLHAMTKEGVLTSESVSIGKRVRKYYKLTDSGKKKVKTTTTEVIEFAETLQQLFAARPITG